MDSRSDGRIETLADDILREERAQPELVDDEHDEQPVAHEIGLSDDAMAVVTRLAGSDDPLAQAAAAHVLGIRANGHPGYAVEAVAILQNMLATAEHLHLQWSIADALRLAWDVSAVQPLLTLTGHDSPNVRRKAAMGLGHMVDTIVPAGVAGLVRLSEDPDDGVRDWATFGLANMDADSDEVRAALWARVGDPYYDARCEGLVGLARRRDPRVCGLVARELTEGDAVGRLVVEAAALLGRRELVEPLLELKEWWDVDPELLDRAIAACRLGQPFNPDELLSRRG